MLRRMARPGHADKTTVDHIHTTEIVSFVCTENFHSKSLMLTHAHRARYESKPIEEKFVLTDVAGVADDVSACPH